MTTLREIPDELWQRIEPKIPVRPQRTKGGRKPADNRIMLNGIFYVLRGGIAWREMPEKYGPWSTVYTRFRQWRNEHFFADIWRVCLQYYDDQHGIDWEWQSCDGAYARSPLGGPDNGPNPTDRAKPGMQDELVVDGRGVPLALITTPANINDHISLPELLENPVIVRPLPTTEAEQNLCLDAAFDNEATRLVLCRANYVGHITPKGGRPDNAPHHEGGQARRWVVERTHAWLDRFRRLVTNWEKSKESRYAFLCLACAIIAFRF
jgi:transposase